MLITTVVLFKEYLEFKYARLIINDLGISCQYDRCHFLSWQMKWNDISYAYYQDHIFAKSLVLTAAFRQRHIHYEQWLSDLSSYSTSRRFKSSN